MLNEEILRINGIIIDINQMITDYNKKHDTRIRKVKTLGGRKKIAKIHSTVPRKH